jgi:hypothetical protein
MLLVLAKADFIELVGKHRLNVLFGRRHPIGHALEVDARGTDAELKLYTKQVRDRTDKDARTVDLLRRTICNAHSCKHLDADQTDTIVQV